MTFPKQISYDNAGIEISAQFCGFRDAHSMWDTYFDFIHSGINSPIFGAARIEYVLSAIPFVKALGITDMIIRQRNTDNCLVHHRADIQASVFVRTRNIQLLHGGIHQKHALQLCNPSDHNAFAEIAFADGDQIFELCRSDNAAIDTAKTTNNATHESMSRKKIFKPLLSFSS